jgi:hypothetical protein
MRAVLPQIRGSEIERARRKRPEDLAAYGLTMRAFPFVFASNPTAAKQALDLLYQAIELEPDYAPATSLAAWCHVQLVLYNGTPSPAEERKNALLLSDGAGILDPDASKIGSSTSIADLPPEQYAYRPGRNAQHSSHDGRANWIMPGRSSCVPWNLTQPSSGAGSAVAGSTHIRATLKTP